MSKIKDTFFGGDEKRAAKKVAAGQVIAGEQIREAEQLGVEEQRQQFAATQESITPFAEAGVSALQQQQALLGLSGQEAQQTAFAGIQESAGQRFIRQRQEKALLRNASAIGGLGGGNVRTALQEQAVGFAQQDIESQFGRLGILAGRGQDAVTNIGQFGSTAATNIQAGLGRAGAGVAGGTTGFADARAAGILAKGAALRSGITQVAGAVTGGITGGPVGALEGAFGV